MFLMLLVDQYYEQNVPFLVVQYYEHNVRNASVSYDEQNFKALSNSGIFLNLFQKS